jgi:hypothetical protein
VKRRLGALAPALGVFALLAVPAAAAPHLSPVTTHMPSGVTPASVEIEPDGTAYVQGESLSKEVLLPEVYVYSAARTLLRKFAIPAGTGLAAFGNGELYVGGEVTEHLYGVNPQSGAIASEVGTQNEGFPGKIGDPRGVAIAPGGTIYETGGEVTVPEPSDPDSVMSIHPIETFSPSGAYRGYIEPHVYEGDAGVLAANSAGDVLASWGTNKGIGVEGVLSPQGTPLTQLSVFPPHAEVKGGSFSADGSSIYAGVVVHRGAKGSTFVARLSFSGKILEQFGSIPTHNAANFWEYDGVQVAANGDGWAIRSVPGKLYRFHA